MQPHSHLQPEILVEGYDCLTALSSSAFHRRISKICSCSCVMLEGTRGVAVQSGAEEAVSWFLRDIFWSRCRKTWPIGLLMPKPRKRGAGSWYSQKKKGTKEKQELPNNEAWRGGRKKASTEEDGDERRKKGKIRNKALEVWEKKIHAEPSSLGGSAFLTWHRTQAI